MEPNKSAFSFHFSLFSLAIGLLFFAASLTPSLIPRGPFLQGVLGGLVLGLGYFCGRIIEMVWSLFELPVPHGDRRRLLPALLVIAAAVLLFFTFLYSLVWQNDLRERMGMDLATNRDTLYVIFIAAIVFVVLYLLGFVIAIIYRLVRRLLLHIMTERQASVLGSVLVVLLLFVITRDGLGDAAIEFLDTSYEAAQNLFEDAPPAPTDPSIPGGPGSLVTWDAMGQPGRDFVTSGPSAEAISAFTGAPALDPIRVYVGRANGDTPQERADLALAELQRLDAFDREVLVIVSPTGTGWMDPGSHEPLEYMHGGDIATVSTQYSFLNSPFALVFETQLGLEQATATIDTIYNHWRTLPESNRPRLYIHGLSLGAWSSMYATNLRHLVTDPINGAFWAGPPFPSSHWRAAQRSRNEGTPWVLPEVGDGSLIRFASSTSDGSSAPADWGDVRVMFLQYPSDPIVFYEPRSLFRPPHWMEEPPGHGVSPYLRFMPVVTQFQLLLDMALSLGAAPAGFGHAYYAQDYIGPWVQMTDPEGWTEADTERLKTHCDNGLHGGCSNDAAPPPDNASEAEVEAQQGE
jgi:uncharacterized membrane protein